MDEIHFELDCDISTRHFHEELEIMYVLTGRIAVLVDGSNFILQAEEFIVFNPFEHHEVYQEMGNHILSVFIPIAILQQVGLGRVHCCSYLQQEQIDYFQLLRARLAIMFKSYIDRTLYRKAHVLSHLFGFLAILKQQFEIPEDKIRMTVEMERIKEIILYINAHFSENISLQSTADHFFISNSHLSRVFQKEIGSSFSEYLRKLRLNKAAWLLRTSGRSVTDIALECGFANTNTFIVNFRKEFRLTPKVYRNEYAERKSVNQQELTVGANFYMSLLRHTSHEELAQPLNKKQMKLVEMKAGLGDSVSELKSCHQEAICIGWAKELLLENMRNAIRKAVKEIGFHFIYFHGMLDDSIDIYHEAPDGTVYLSFTYLDMIFDFVLDVGAKPWVEFGYTPQKLVSNITNLFGSSCINLPDDPEKWRFLVEGVMEHFIERYGVEEVGTWKYSPSAELYNAYEVFTFENYLAYYRYTYDGIRNKLPIAHISGCMMDTGFITLDGGKYLIQFLEYSYKYNCMPDEFTFQCFQRDYSKEPRFITENKLSVGDGVQEYEPARISANPNVLAEQILLVYSIINAHKGAGRPITVHSFNSTIWQGDLGNDTCFKAAYIVKSFLENAAQVNGLTYCYLTDYTERRLTNLDTFHGGLGLMTYQGLPKAAYYSYWMLNQLSKHILIQGEGYIITCSENKKKLQILLYHYCHYNMETHIDYVLPVEEQRTRDRYYGFEDPGVKNFRINLSGLIKGVYDKESYSINREHGSSYDAWMLMGAPKIITKVHRSYLDKASEPGIRHESIWVDENGELLISAVLDAHEVRLICIEKK